MTQGLLNNFKAAQDASIRAMEGRFEEQRKEVQEMLASAQQV